MRNLIMLIFLTISTLFAVDIKLDGNIEKIAGNSDSNYCEAGDKFRVGTTTTYNGEQIDLIVEVIAEDNEYDEYSSSDVGKPCIGVANGLLETRLRDHDNDNSKLAYMDLKITPVIKDTDTVLEIDRFVFSGFDLDTYDGAGTDDLYLRTPTIGYVSPNSNVVYSEGDFGDNFDKKLKGQDSGNCDDTKDSPEPSCRAGGIIVDGTNGFNKVDGVYIRVSNDNAYSDSTNTQAYRLIQISFEEIDFNVMLDGAVDYGDANSSYQSAYNTIDVSMILGPGLVADNETEQQVSDNADGDDQVEANTTNFDDEDSMFVVHDGNKNYDLYINQNNNIEVTTIGRGYINVWIDFNEDGDFDDDNEHVVIDSSVDSSTAQVNSYSINVPLDVNFNTNTVMRLRFSDTDGINPYGDGGKGETEDQLVKLVATAPTAVDDNKTGVVGEAVTVDVLSNDTDPEGDIDPTTVKIKDANGNDVTTLEVVNEGTWSVDSQTGKITFTPEDGFTADPTPIKYIVKDKTGKTSNEATVTIDYTQEAKIALEKNAVVNDGGDGLQAGDTITYTFKVTNIGNVALSDVAIDDDRIGVSNLSVGNLDVNETKELNVTYTITDSDINDGKVENQATVTAKDPDGNSVTDKSDDPNDTTNIDPNKDGNPDDITVTPLTTNPPVANDDSATGVVGEAVTVDVLSNDTDPEGDIDPTTVKIIYQDGNDVESRKELTTLTVDGEGTWSVDSQTGKITFTPEDGFTADPTPIKYTVKDKTGKTSNEATVTVDYAQEPKIALEKVGIFNDTNNDGYAQVGETITYKFTVKNIGNAKLTNVTVTDPKVTVNGGPIDLDVGQEDSSTFSAVYTITQEDIDNGKVENQATVTAKDPDGKDVTDKSDDPNNPTNIDLDGDGNPDDVTVTKVVMHPPVATDNVEKYTPGKSITVNVVNDDSDVDGDLDPTSVRIVNPNGELVTTLKVPGEGTWSVDDKGDITFTPEDGFTGVPAPIEYVVKDKTGKESNKAELKLLAESTSSCLNGSVWYDKNYNGIKDSSEPGVVDIPVHLYNSNGDLIETIKTDKSGNYSFCNVVAGNDYKVKVDIPNTYMATFKYRGSNDNLDSDIDTKGVIDIKNFSSNSSYDAGIYCECDDYYANPENRKEVSASAFSSFGAIISILLLGLIARRRDR